MTYDLHDVSAPRTAGLALRLLVFLAERSSPRSLLIRQLLDAAGVSMLRALSAGEEPSIFHSPLDAPQRRAPPPSEQLDGARFLAAAADNEDSSGDGGFRFVSAGQLTDAYGSGRCSPVDVARRVLSCIEASEQGERPLRLFIAQQPDDLLQQAERSAARYREGAPLGPLDGVPVAVKDELDQQGYPTTVGTRVLGTAPAAHDAEAASRLRRAGALLVGKANMHEIGMGVTGLNPHHGAARNPYDPDRATGGSSSGPAAAVAAGICPLSIGADGGGSIRIPSAMCGVVGLKPSFSRVSEHGVAPVCWSVAHVGPIGATVRDCALGYALMAGPDQADTLSLQQPQPLLPDLQDADLRGVVLGIFEPWFNDAEPAVVQACQQAMERLVAAGAELKSIEIPELSVLRTAHLVTIVSEMAASQILQLREHRSQYGLDTRLNMALAGGLTAQDYVHAQRQRARLAHAWRRIYGQVDAIVTPSSGCTAPLLRPDALPHGESDLPLTVRIMRFAQAANLFGLPGISVPAGYDEAGLPIGLQLMGRAWEEALLLRMAAVVERGLTRRAPVAHQALLEA